MRYNADECDHCKCGDTVIIEPVILKKEEGGGGGGDIPRTTINLNSFGVSGKTQYYPRKGSKNVTAAMRTAVTSLCANLANGDYTITVNCCTRNSGNTMFATTYGTPTYTVNVNDGVVTITSEPTSVYVFAASLEYTSSGSSAINLSDAAVGITSITKI